MKRFVKLDDIDGFLASIGLPPYNSDEGWESDYDTQECRQCYTIGLEKIYIFENLENSDILEVKTW